MSLFLRLLRRTFSTSPQPSTPAPVSTTVKSLSEEFTGERSLERLVQKFKKYSEIDRFRTKSRIYEVVVHRLARAKRFQWIEEILEDQKKYMDISKEDFNARLIRLYAKSGMFEKAHKVFDEISERNCKRTVLSFNALLAACLLSKKFDKADELFKELPEKLDIKPNLISYNTIIKAYCEMGSTNSGVSLLDEMEKKGIEPDLVTFNTLLHVFYANGHFSDGEKIWSRMMKKKLKPDMRCYHSKLVGLTLEKRPKDAVLLIVEMRKKGIKLDVFCFNMLIKGFVSENNLEKAKEWYHRLRRSNCKPHKSTYEVLIPFVCEKDDLYFARGLFKNIFHTKLVVDRALLQLVVDGFVRDSKMEESKELVELAGNKNNHRCYKLKLPGSDE